jgi:hypothetical protein
MLVEFIAAAVLATANPEPALPAWMAGCWEQKTGGRWTEECWSRPRDGMMLGYGRSGAGERVNEWESMQIGLQKGEAAVRMGYWAAPGGNDRTLFAWTPSNQPGVTFYNAAHDYPQRIRYWREGRYLMAETSLQDGRNPKRWRYVRQAN